MSNNSVNRRQFLKKSMKTALTAAASGPLAAMNSCSPGPFSTDPDLPNILFITADNLGIGDLSCYGNRSIKTPNIDSIGIEGVQFENAFVVSSSCAPSRASFVTGQYPHTHGVDALTHLKKTKALSPFHTTLPDLLKKKGYNTAVEGKWHISPYMPTSWYGYNERLSGIMPKDHVIKDSKKTIDFLKRNKDNRFFLQVNYKNSHRDIHGEYQYDPDFPVDPDSITIPGYMNLPNWPEIREDVARYYSQNLRMEQMVGEVLGALDDLGLRDNTLVMFVSDNGPHYPGMISTLYDRGTATPMLVRWPGKIKPGKKVDHLINTIDIMPTFLDAAGIEIPEEVQGRSFYRMLVEDNAPATQEAVFMEMTDHVRYIPCRAIRTERWKYIHNYSDNAFGLDMNNHDEWAHRLCELPGQGWKSPRPEHELYDLKNDPNEINNLAKVKRYSDKLKSLQARLKDFQKRTGDDFLGHPFTKDFDPEEYKPVEPGHEYW